MRLKDRLTTDIVTSPRESASPRRGRRPAAAAAQQSSLPTTLPRPVKLTRDRTYTVPPPATFVCSALKWKTTIATTLRESLA
jgi:hypothetical protein